MKEKIKSLIIIFAYYIFVSVICIFIGYFIKDYFNIYITVLLCDIIGTILIFLIGLYKKTASLYDPYWSVAPIVISLILIIYFSNFSLMIAIIFISLILWSIRLTFNFSIDFKNFKYVDYRYEILKKKTGKFYSIVNLLGICMFPTLIVYMALIPFIYLVSSNVDSTPLFLLGVIIINIGTFLELISDLESRKFRRTRSSNKELLRSGIWKYSRHPNYLGEILIWWGLYLSVVVTNNSPNFLIIGAILNTCLFLFISIPMADKHLKSYKENYSEYRENTWNLLPFKKIKFNNRHDSKINE